MMSDEYREWVESLQPGDEVLVPSQWSTPKIIRVARLTTTQIVLVDDRRYHLVGRLVGKRVKAGSYSSIEPVTAQIREEIEHADLVNWIRDVWNRTRNGRDLTTAQIRAMQLAHDHPEISNIMRTVVDLPCENPDRCVGACDACKLRVRATEVLA